MFALSSTNATKPIGFLIRILSRKICFRGLIIVIVAEITSDHLYMFLSTNVPCRKQPVGQAVFEVLVKRNSIMESIGMCASLGYEINMMFKSRLVPHKRSILFGISIAKPHSSVGSVTELRTGGRWFDPRLGQYSFRGLMIVIASGFIPLSPLSVVSTMVRLKSSQSLGKNIVWSTG